MAEIHSPSRSTVHRAPACTLALSPHRTYTVTSIGDEFLLVYIMPEAAIPPDSYRLAVSKKRCMDLFICVCVCHPLRACCNNEGPAIVSPLALCGRPQAPSVITDQTLFHRVTE